MFPHIKDWTDPQDHLRNSYLRDLTHQEWIWFHPSAFALIKYGTPSSACITFSLVAWLFLRSGNDIISYIFAFAAAIMVYELFRLIYNKQSFKGVTMYDTFMREGEF